MRKTLSVLLCALAILAIAGVVDARAQQQQPTVTRYVTMTSFDVPFTDRTKVMSFMEEYFLPGYQLNPNVRNFRMLLHNWGSDASQIIFAAEFDNWAAIEADCGKPCEDYFAKHPTPEEGQPGYAEYREKSDLFSKYYASHRDEIYASNMRWSVVDGVAQGRVGPALAGN